MVPLAQEIDVAHDETRDWSLSQPDTGRGEAIDKPKLECIGNCLDFNAMPGINYRTTTPPTICTNCSD